MNPIRRLDWSNLDPTWKRFAVIGGGLLVIVAAAWLLTTGNRGRVSGVSPGKETTRHILTDRSTREIGIDQLAASVEMMRRENADLKRRVEVLDRQQDDHHTPLSATARASERARNAELSKLRARLDTLDKKYRELSKERKHDSSHAKQGHETARSDMQAAHRERVPVFPDRPVDDVNPEDYFRTLSTPSPATQRGHEKPGREGDVGASSKPPSSPKIAVITEPGNKTGEKGQASEREKRDVYLPAGSILTGVLLNGMDAPTSSAARHDPFPSTLRLKLEAILPNRFRADVRECFVIVSGYGDLSSQRAYLRGETISCVREDGGVIETGLDSYAVGEDGKTGIRGRLVSKQGQVIAKSLMAGFLAGVSKAFNVSPVPTLATEISRSMGYQQVFSKDLLQGAAVQGASSALDRIAQFYIDMADGIFPVIEIDAGRAVDLIVTHGASLRLR